MTVHVDRMLETKNEHNVDKEALPKQTLKKDQEGLIPSYNHTFSISECQKVE
jgi:hypothetical protein